MELEMDDLLKRVCVPYANQVAMCVCMILKSHLGKGLSLTRQITPGFIGLTRGVEARDECVHYTFKTASGLTQVRYLPFYDYRQSYFSLTASTLLVIARI